MGVGALLPLCGYQGSNLGSRPGGKCPYPLRHLASPVSVFQRNCGQTCLTFVFEEDTNFIMVNDNIFLLLLKVALYLLKLFAI